GPVLSVGEAIEDEHLKAREAFVEIDHPVNGRLKVLAPWIRFSESACSLSSPAPTVGQHNRDIYGDLLGFSEQQIGDLKARGVIS
ncbi:MAG: CoA transferase, partial [Betaproteobacteria bacterium]|nr:CoA transferase [Betaproteobacteria bacterium]